MSLPQFDVTDQKVIVVGAGRGIGKGIACLLYTSPSPRDRG